MINSITVAKHRLLLIFIGVALVAIASLPFVLSAAEGRQHQLQTRATA